MKTKISVLLALAFTIAGFSQKDEMKAATKALKGGDAAAAKTALESIASIDGADDKTKAAYYNLKGNVYADLAKKGDASAYDTAIEAYNMLISLEESTGKKKFTTIVNDNLENMRNDLVAAGSEAYKNKDFKTAAEKFYKGYSLRKTDTIILYYAATGSVQGGDYDTALKYYNELNDLNYDGSELSYTAVNVETGEVENFGSDKGQRDLMVKATTHKDPSEETTPSKRGEIVKNIALIYSQQGKKEEALQAFDTAIANYPDDANLLLNKANIYYEMGETEKYKELIEKALVLTPDNSDLYYNLGVTAQSGGQLDEAIGYYDKAIELNPKYINSYVNKAIAIVAQQESIVEEMNSLGTSSADNKKYNELDEKRKGMIQESTDVLEQALLVEPKNPQVLDQLKNNYYFLEDTENFKRIKAMIDGE